MCSVLKSKNSENTYIKTRVLQTKLQAIPPQYLIIVSFNFPHFREDTENVLIMLRNSKNDQRLGNKGGEKSHFFPVWG